MPEVEPEPEPVEPEEPSNTFNDASDAAAEKLETELKSETDPAKVFKDASKEALSTGDGSLFEASSEDIERDAKNADVDPDLVKSAYKQMLETIRDKLTLQDDATMESVLSDPGLPDAIVDKLSAEEQTAFGKTLRAKGASFMLRITKSFPSLKNIKANLKLTNDSPSNATERAQAEAEIESAVDGELSEDPSIERKASESAARQDVARAEEGKPPTKESSFKSVLKLITSLSSLAGLGALIGAFIKYCLDNTGCMEIYTDSEGIQQKQKILCNNNTSFAPQNCKCLADSTTSKQVTVNSDKQCSDGTTLPEETGNTACKNKDNLDANDYVYYSYQVMNPIDAIPDIANKIIKIPEEGANMLLGILKKVAIVVVILVVLYIIFKLIMMFMNKRKS
jgi:hypothetical protein